MATNHSIKRMNGEVKYRPIFPVQHCICHNANLTMVQILVPQTFNTYFVFCPLCGYKSESRQAWNDALLAWETAQHKETINGNNA